MIKRKVCQTCFLPYPVHASWRGLNPSSEQCAPCLMLEKYTANLELIDHLRKDVDYWAEIGARLASELEEREQRICGSCGAWDMVAYCSVYKKRMPYHCSCPWWRKKGK